MVYVEDMERQTQRNTKQIGDIKSRMDADAEKLKINGFMTASVSPAYDVLGTDYRFDEPPNFRGDAKVGLQFNYKIGENSSAVVQMVARGRSNEPWEANADRAVPDESYFLLLTDKLSAKLEWNHYYDLGEDNSGSVGNGASGFSANQGDDADVYTLSLDAVF